MLAIQNRIERLPYISRIIETQPVNISPQLAELMLARANPANRNNPDWRIAEVAAAIQRGEWTLTHQGIAFSCDGILLDGHTRLRAIIKAQKTVCMLVTFGLPRDSAIAMDSGKNRSVSDVFHLKNHLGQTLRLAAALGSGFGRVTNRQVELLVNTDLRAAVEIFVESPNSKAKYIGASASILALAILYCLNDGFPDRQEYILEQFRIACRADFANATMRVNALMKQILTGTINAVGGSNDIYARVWKAFDPDARDKSTLIVNSGDVRRVRIVMRDYLLSIAPALQGAQQ